MTRTQQSTSAKPIDKTNACIPMTIRIMDNHLDNIIRDVPFEKLQEYIANPSHTWIDILCVTDNDFGRLSELLNIPKPILESGLSDESYPRIDYFEHFAMVFAKIANTTKLDEHSIQRFLIDRSGILVICQGQNIVTLSKTHTDIFDLLLSRAKKIHSAEEPLVVSVLYTVFKYVLEKDQEIISAVEQELLTLEGIPIRNRPSNFLETAFYFRREINRMVPSLLHLKEIISMIITKRVPLEGFSERHEKLFDILMDESVYLHETAADLRDNLQSMVDLYINTSSYQMNRVMRVIAILTALGIIPAIVLGAFGTNITGSPWNFHLWQVLLGVGILMALMGWVFYKLGWFRG